MSTCCRCCYALLLAQALALDAVLKPRACTDLRVNISQPAATRTGSTALGNILQALLPNCKHTRFHPTPAAGLSGLQRLHTVVQSSVVLTTIRHPLDALISGAMLVNDPIRNMLAAQPPTDRAAIRDAFTQVDWHHLVTEWMHWGGQALLSFFREQRLSASNLAVRDKVLLTPYERLVGNDLGTCVRRIADFMRCEVDSSMVQRIVSENSIAATENYLDTYFKEQNFTKQGTGWMADGSVSGKKYHYNHVSPMHGQTNFEDLLSHETIQHVLGLAPELQNFVELFWPARTRWALTCIDGTHREGTLQQLTGLVASRQIECTLKPAGQSALGR